MFSFKPGVIDSILPVRCFLPLWLCLLMSPAMAQVSFTTVANTKDMGKSDYVQIQYSIENAQQIDHLEPPDFPDFTVVQGPSESTGTTIVNGAVSQNKSVSFVLQPKHPGKFTIQGATALVDGHPMRSGPVTINVRNVSSYGNSSQPNNFNPLPDPGWPSAEPQVDMETVIKPGENVAEKIRKNLFIRVDVSKKECYLGEPIVVTYKLYSRLQSESRVLKHPSLNGFSVYDMLDPSSDQSSVEKVNGKNFTVHVIRKAQLIALQSGDIVLDPVEIDNNIYFTKLEKAQSSKQGFGSLLDRLFGQESQGTPFSQHLTLDSKPVTIHVKPLPEAGKPADFNGAVGRYSIGAALDSKEIHAGDAAILSLTVKGDGNLPMINAPVVEWPANMESYDVSSKENINKETAPLGGSKTYSYSFSCTKPGQYILPPVKLCYFDPSANAYKTVQSDPVHVQISPGGKGKSSPVPVISIPTTLIAGGWVKNILWIIGGILIGSLGIYFLMRKKRAIRPAAVPAITEPVVPVAPIEPPAPVIDPLRESKEYAGSGDYGKFYASVNRAIWKAVSDKLKLPASELNKLNISAGLRSRGWDDEEIIQLKSLLNECEMKLYTPHYSSSDVVRTLEAAERVTAQLVTAS
ncbi:MAG: BatD family protein [Bacteroidota bacterium]|nr:BatD family protein [Bacteroidota bacterium]